MFDFPHVVDAKFVAEFYLRDSFLVQTALEILAPRLWQLVLVEHPEFHCRFLRSAAARCNELPRRVFLGDVGHHLDQCGRICRQRLAQCAAQPAGIADAP